MERIYENNLPCSGSTVGGEMGLGINKEDTVYVITGKEKGKKGRVLLVDKGKNRVLVEKVNIIKKHMKPNKKYAQAESLKKRPRLLFRMSCSSAPSAVSRPR